LSIRTEHTDTHADDHLIGARDLARRLGVTRGTVYRWLRDGKLTAAWTSPGGRFKFRTDLASLCSDDVRESVS
jgi:excisionase family DNA binding protein